MYNDIYGICEEVLDNNRIVARCYSERSPTDESGNFYIQNIKGIISVEKFREEVIKNIENRLEGSVQDAIDKLDEKIERYVLNNGKEKLEIESPQIPISSDVKEDKIYTTIKICHQVWITENFNESIYKNGNPIPQVQDPEQWKNLTTGAWCYYENHWEYGKHYGKLYNWYAVADPRGLCPTL